MHCGNGELPGLQRELGLSFQHLHQLEDETAGRPEEGETSSTKSRRYLGWLNEDLGAERANAGVLGVEVVRFIDRMGEAGSNATGNKILEHERLEEEHADAAQHKDCVFSFLTHHRDPFERALSECGVSVDPAAKVESLSIAERQLVEIVKGVALAPRVLILDEPTSSLTIHEVQELFAILRRLALRGTAIVYISHKLDEIFAITDRVTVLRDGRKVATAPTGEWTESTLVRAMVGRDLSALFPHVPSPLGTARLEVRGLMSRGAFGPVSFALRSGEIVGLYGIIGAGRSELAMALFGLAPVDGGSIRRCQSKRRLVGVRRDCYLARGDLRRESAPLGQGCRASLLVDLPRNEMALLIELVVHLSMN